MEIRVVRTHYRPHPDEIVATELVRRFGGRKLMLAAGWKVEFVDAGSKPEGGRTADDWLNDGVLYLGVGGGMFDEHATNTSERKQGKTCAQLVAEYLGVSPRRDVRSLLRYVNRDDLEGSSYGLGDFAAVVSRKWEYGRGTPEEAFNCLLDIAAEWLDANAEFEYRADSVVRKAEADGRTISIVVAGRDEPIKLIMFETDCPAAVSHATGYRKYDLVVSRNSRGQVLIMPRRAAALDLGRVAAALRSAEAEARRLDVGAEGLDGEVCPLGIWHAAKTTEGAVWMVANGTKSAPNTRPTALSVSQIYMTIKNNL